MTALGTAVAKGFSQYVLGAANPECDAFQQTKLHENL
jgi:hypothetical protein